MKKLLKLILIAVFLGIHPVSCDRHGAGDCGDLSNYPKVIRIAEINHYLSSLSHVSGEMYRENGIIEDNSYRHPDSIGIGLSIDKTTRIASLKTFNFGFTQTAIACSPAPPAVQNYVTKVDIIYAGLPIIFNTSTELINPGDTISNLFGVFSRDTYCCHPDSLSDQASWNTFSNGYSTFIKLKKYNTDSVSLNIDAHFYLADGDDLDIKNIKLNLLPYKP
ncbi:hypothetical protein [Owenweeksia hongkongensis]|uniref:hypothetical protein n=1 Tax=Owenweeksia hongkongensis TaxID=253245 RepID=UPI003A9023A6